MKIAKILSGQSSPSYIATVVQKAHRFKDESDPAAKKFIWFFLKLRDELKKLKPAQHGELLKKAFRKHGSTFGLE